MRILRSLYDRSRWRLYLFAVLIGASVLAPSARAEEPYEAFIQGLRDRGYYDYVLLYLDTITKDPNAPTTIKELVPFEKATTLQLQAQTSPPETQAQQFEQAMAFLDQFVKNSPNHPRAGEANSRRASILLSQARTEVWQSKSPSNKENRAEFQTKARALIAKARSIFETAKKQHETRWKSFPVHIDKFDNPKQFADRARAEQSFMQAQLNLASCTYEDAQTHDIDSPEYATKLTAAAKEYEAIHTRYRSQVAGLFARAWQGKCFEEQSDIQRALGLYKELLAHPGKSQVMVRLQDQVRQFRLICLNHDSRKDYQLVIQEADQWVAAARGSKKYSQIALGIRWQQALAQVSIAEDRNTAEEDKPRLLSQALKTVQLIKRFPGPYKDLALFKEREINIMLKGAGAVEDPKTFDEAFGLAQELVTKKTKDAKIKRDTALKSGDQDRIKKAKTDFTIHIDKTVGLLRTALKLADEKTPVRDINLARYYLAYMYYLGKDKHYEGAILAEFIANNYAKDNPTQAQDAAMLALALYSNAFNENHKEKRATDEAIDVSRMSDMANFLIQRWPSSDRATEAKFNMGVVQNNLKNYEASAKWYAQVPEVSAKYTEAQTKAGQGYWSAYIEASKPDTPNPGDAKLNEWKAAAETHLRKGIDKAVASLPETGKPTAELVAAKVTLTQILVANAKYKHGLALLTGQGFPKENIAKEKFPVVAAIQVADESKRPTKGGVTSVEFASLVYQLLLRCYIGNQDRDKAREAMKSLESVGGADAARMTEMYRQLGQQLKDELERLEETNQTEQLAAVRNSFEGFLKDMAERQEQSAGSLIWIGETYYGLAQSSSKDAAAGTQYFDSAAKAYQRILDEAESNAEFMPADQLVTVRLRLVNCRRAQGSYEEAEKLIKDVATAKKNHLDVQIEAATLYQTWAETGETEKYRLAISGDGGVIWGWGRTANMLQRQITAGRKNFEEKHLDARHHLVECRYKYAMGQTATAKRKEQLAMAERELITFVRITKDIPDVWWTKFDNVYRDVQKGQGITVPVALERPTTFAPEPVVAQNDNSDGTKKKGSKKKKATKVKPDEPDDPTLTYIVFGIVALGGIGGGIWMIGKSKTRRLTPSMAYAEENPPVIAPPPAAPAKRKKRSGGSSGGSSSSGPTAPADGQPAKQKRQLTPEQKAQLAKKKRAKAQQQKKQKPDGQG